MEVKRLLAEQLAKGQRQEPYSVEGFSGSLDSTHDPVDVFSLARIEFSESDIAWVSYHDGGLFGGCWLTMPINNTGEILDEPHLHRNPS